MSGRPLAMAVVLLLGACTAPTEPGSSASTAGAGGVPRWQHVVVAVLENRDADAVLGSGAAPWTDEMAGRGAVLTDMHGETHPSQGNYLALFSGSTHDAGDDCPLTVDGPTLAGQLADAGLTFAGYAEGLPERGSDVCEDGRYVRRHAPWADFPDVPADVGRPWTDWPADPAELPTVSFVVPDLCHDAHACRLPVADRWLRARLTTVLAGPDWRSGHLAVVVTADEDDRSSGNRVLTVVVHPSQRGNVVGTRLDHYSLSGLYSDVLHAPRLGRAGGAPSMATAFGLPLG